MHFAHPRKALLAEMGKDLILVGIILVLLAYHTTTRSLVSPGQDRVSSGTGEISAPLLY